MPDDQELFKTASSLTQVALGLTIMAEAMEDFKRNQFGATIIPAKDRERVLRLLRSFATTVDDDAVAIEARQKF
jgi:hypothetical protein